MCLQYVFLLSIKIRVGFLYVLILFFNVVSQLFLLWYTSFCNIWIIDLSISIADKETREKEFKYYCKLCDYGTFAKQLIEKHNKSDKHERREKYCK